MGKNRFIRYACFMLAFSILSVCCHRPAFAQVSNASCYSTTEGLQFEVNAVVSNTWNNHANLEITFTNTGEETIHNWTAVKKV